MCRWKSAAGAAFVMIALPALAVAPAHAQQQAQPAQQEEMRQQEQDTQQQDEQRRTTAAADQQTVRQCVTELQAFREQLVGDEYWVSMAEAADLPTERGEAAEDPTRTLPEDPDTPGTVATAPLEATAPAATTMEGAPWVDSGTMTPRQQVRTLFSAAVLLGEVDQEEACRAVLAGLLDVYEGHLAQLRDAGIEPGEEAGRYWGNTPGTRQQQ